MEEADCTAEQFLDVGRFDERNGRIERVEARVVGDILDQADVFDIDSVDLAQLAGEEGYERFVGQFHDELVDCPPGAPFEDVDAHKITAYGTDPTRHCAERTRPVGQPDADDVNGHRGGLAASPNRPVDHATALAGCDDAIVGADVGADVLTGKLGVGIVRTTAGAASPTSAVTAFFFGAYSLT